MATASATPTDAAASLITPRSGRSEDRSSSAVTVKTDKNEKRIKLEKLISRRIQRTSSEDDRLPHLRQVLKTTLPVAPPTDVSGLLVHATNFVNGLPPGEASNYFSVIEKLQLELDKIKYELRCPLEQRTYFQAKHRKCYKKNEAILQRSIMMSAFQQHWLDQDGMFDWNAEGQWYLNSVSRLFTTEEDEITMPKPDLVFSFNREKFVIDQDGSDYRPTALKDCLSPDDTDRNERFFPFLFVEVKRGNKGTLNDAVFQNLHTASQALCNMHRWMKEASQEDQFFNSVRVFSLSLDDENLLLRMHRAARRNDGHLSFRFVNLLDEEKKKYDRDMVCLWISAILKDFAAEELYHLLYGAYKLVVEKEEQVRIAKRKLKALDTGKGKRPRKSAGAEASTSLTQPIEETTLGEDEEQ